MMSENLSFPRPNDLHVKPSISLLLKADGRYRLIYEDHLMDARGSWQPGGDVCRTIEGSWSVPDRELVLEGLGSATRWNAPNRNQGVALSFADWIPRPEFDGRPAGMELGVANFDPDQRPSFCF
jgi:hypothetical protein